MSESVPIPEQHYRKTAEEIRRVAVRAGSDEIRDELLQLAERYERLADRSAWLRTYA